MSICLVPLPHSTEPVPLYLPSQLVDVLTRPYKGPCSLKVLSNTLLQKVSSTTSLTYMNIIARLSRNGKHAANELQSQLKPKAEPNPENNRSRAYLCSPCGLPLLGSFLCSCRLPGSLL